MQQLLNISVPTSWQSLTDTQLRYLYSLLCSCDTIGQVEAHCLLKWADLQILRHEGTVIIVKHNGKIFPLSSEQIAEATEALRWIRDVPVYPVRISYIRLKRAVRADLQGVSFEDFIILDNLYQGYLATQKPELLNEMAKILYDTKSIHLKPEEEINIFYWFTAAKKMFSKMFYHLFKPINSDYTPMHPTLEQLQTSMDTQIRALTGGDITKEKEVLKMDCWRALTELNAKAKDYEDIKKNIHI